MPCLKHRKLIVCGKEKVHQNTVKEYHYPNKNLKTFRFPEFIKKKLISVQGINKEGLQKYAWQEIKQKVTRHKINNIKFSTTYMQVALYYLVQVMFEF